MNTNVSIINIALVKLGSSKINSMTEDSEEAVKASAIYTNIKEAMLEEHLWNFACKRTTLSPLVSTPQFEYTYKFNKPNDCERILSTYPFGVEYKVEGNHILCNESVLRIRYLSNTVTEDMFSSNFVQALSCRIAAELCYSITGSGSEKERLMAEYEDKLRLARSLDAQEGTPDEVDDLGSSWLDVRYG